MVKRVKKVKKAVGKKAVKKISGKKVVKKTVSKNVVLNPWFEKRPGSIWTFSPINRGGYFALFLLFALNLFAAAYFNLQDFVLDNYLKMGVVLLLSVFVFYEICRRRIKND